MPWMTESDICSLYRNAKNQQAQVNILAQLNAVKAETIRNILRKNGITPAEPKAVKHRKKAQKQWTVEELLRFMHLLNEGKSNQELAELFDRSIGAIRCVRAKLNPEIISNPSQNIKTALEIFEKSEGACV